jgi:hypothetical protein
VSLKSEAEAPKNAKCFITSFGQGGGKYTPDEINTEYAEYIVNTGSQLEIGFSIEGLETMSFYKIE